MIKPIQNTWYLAVRLSTLENYENKNSLGDQTIGSWIQQQADGILQYSTNIYTDLYGLGNPKKTDIAKLHLIYIEQTRIQQLVYGKLNLDLVKKKYSKDHQKQLNISKNPLKQQILKINCITKMLASPQVVQKELIISISKIYNEKEIESVSEYGYGF